MNAANTVHSQNCWIWALVAYGPIKQLGFLSREDCMVCHVGMVDQRWSGASLRCLWSHCFGPCVVVCEREPPFFPRSGLSLTEHIQISLHLSTAALLWKLMNCRDGLYIVCYTGDFEATIPEINTSNFGPLPPQNNSTNTLYQLFLLISWNVSKREQWCMFLLVLEHFKNDNKNNVEEKDVCSDYSGLCKQASLLCSYSFEAL